MRMLVGYEGETPAGHYIVPNSIRMVALTVPVYEVSTSREKPVGLASNLRREEDSKALTMAISLLPEYVLLIDPKKYEARVELYDLDAEKKQNGKLIIRKATLGSIALKRI